ncbi:MAG: VWA domain-containing protein [Phycisphaerales bacterium]|nr:VWA domain-containing protein [Phycisphaerales bacterium]
MNALLNKLFGLDGIGFGSPGTDFVFLRPVGAWAWVLLAGAIGFLSWWSYRGLAGTKPTRTMLAGVRTLLVVLLLVLAAGPLLERVTMHTDRDSVLVLLDRSGSLATPDADGQPRDAQLGAMLIEGSEQWTDLSESKRVAWFTFNDRTALIAQGQPPETLAEIGGKGSNLGSAITDALAAHGGQPIAGIVVVSDGQSTDAITPELLTELTNASIAVFTVPLGSPDPVRDASIVRVQSPELIFADDRAPVRVDINWSGIEAGTAPITLDLIDHATGQVVASVPIDPKDFAGGSTHQYTLHHALNTPGETKLDIVLNTTSAADMNPGNNQSSIALSVVDRPLRVLYIDGYPRWEQRYLKNLLTREDSIESTAMLLAADRRYKQDGDVVIDRIPTSKDQWEPYDVVILGDVRAELFTPEQLDGLREHIAEHGAGLLWIGGPSATPSSWLTSPIAGLLPMYPPTNGRSGIATWDQSITMDSTPEADRLGILQLGDDGWEERLRDPATGWSQLRLVQRIDFDTLKPGAVVLATAHPVDTIADSSPVVLSMRYAGGQVGYVATDEIWRWRYGRGEALPERFWLPMIRMLARGTIARGSAPALLRVAPAFPQPGKPVQLVVDLLDQSLVDTLPKAIDATITRIGSKDAGAHASLLGSQTTRLGTWIPQEPGQYRVALESADPMLASINATISVLDSSDERRTLDTNHPLLADLASQTGGQVIKPEDFGTIPSMLPNRARTIALPPERVSLWDRPIVLFFLILLVSIEWIGRKSLRLA